MESRLAKLAGYDRLPWGQHFAHNPSPTPRSGRRASHSWIHIGFHSLGRLPDPVGCAPDDARPTVVSQPAGVARNSVYAQFSMGRCVAADLRRRCARVSV